MRLIQIKDEMCGGSSAELSRRIGKDATYVSRMLYPHGKTGKKNITEGMQEAVERAFNLPKDWLDGEQSNVEPAPPLRKKGVPLISWVQAGDWCEAHDPYAVGDAELWLPAADNYSENAYALRVRGASMEPRFREGEIIVINPDGAADSGKFVIARKEGSKEVTFKQLIREGDEAYLKAINPQWPEPIIRMDEAWHICGVVACKMEIF